MKACRTVISGPDPNVPSARTFRTNEGPIQKIRVPNWMIMTDFIRRLWVLKLLDLA